MNRVFKSVWNAVRQVRVVVSETQSSHGAVRSAVASVAVLSLLAAIPQARADELHMESHGYSQGVPYNYAIFDNGLMMRWGDAYTWTNESVNGKNWLTKTTVWGDWCTGGDACSSEYRYVLEIGYWKEPTSSSSSSTSLTTEQQDIVKGIIANYTGSTKTTGDETVTGKSTTGSLVVNSTASVGTNLTVPGTPPRRARRPPARCRPATRRLRATRPSAERSRLQARQRSGMTSL